jgi:hypothetical protein
VIPTAPSPEAEQPVLDQWILDRAEDPRFRFYGGDGIDPRAQTEDIGSDPVLASSFGIANLQRVLPQLPAWTATPGEDYGDLAELYGELVSSYARYVGHVITRMGGVYHDAKATDQAGPVFTPVAATDQRRAQQFLAEQVYRTPQWLVDAEVLSRIEASGALERVRGVQASVVTRVLDANRLQRMTETELTASDPTYRASELLSDTRQAIWSELPGRAVIDPFRRQLQRVHVDRLATLVAAEGTVSEARPLARAELVALQGGVRSRIARGGDATTLAHLRDVAARIEEALDTSR